MKRTIFATLLGCAIAGAAMEASAQRIHKPGEVRYVKGRLLVQPRAGLTLQELDNKLKPHGGRRVGQIPKINVHIIQLPSKANEHAVAALLKNDSHIEFAEVDQQVPPDLTPNDPDYLSGWHLPKVGTPKAWDSSDGTGVNVAILDSGVDSSHPDLAGSLVPGYNAFDKNSDTRDVEGHGTETAGTAAMAGNNLLGGTGVAYKARIMPIRVTDTNGYGYFSSMATGLVWAADNGARVANISFRGACGSSTVMSAAEYMRSKGGVVTGSAGNTGVEEPYTPSESMTCVSAVDSSDTRPSWAAYGKYVDVAAPGVSIYTTRRGGSYGFLSGSSYAAPLTAGIYALMIAANPRLTPDQLDEALFSSAVNLGNTLYYGHGRVDAAAAVAAARGTSSGDASAPKVTISTPSNGSNVNGLVAVDVGASDDTGVARVELYADGSLLGSDATVPYAFSWDASNVSGDVVLEARAYDAAGNVGSASVTVTVSGDSSAPSVTISTPQAGTLITSPTTISASATDDKRVAKVNLTINGKEVAVSYGSSLNYTWDPYAGIKGKGKLKNVAGTYTIRSTATDDSGNSSSTAVSVTVQ